MSAIARFAYHLPIRMTAERAPTPAPLESDDALLARLVAQDDEGALAALLSRHWARAFALAHRVVRDPAQAADVAQEVFVRLARAARGYEGSGRFDGFLARIVVNEARNALRSQKRRARHEEASLARGGGGSSGGGREDDLAVAVDAHLARLPEDLRTPLALHYQEGLTHEEVGLALGIATGTASSRLRRGLEKLRESLAREGLAGVAPSLEAIGALLRQAPAAPPAPPAPSAASIRARARALDAARLLPKVAASGAAAIAVGAIGAWLALGDGGAPPSGGSGAPAKVASGGGAAPSGTGAGTGTGTSGGVGGGGEASGGVPSGGGSPSGAEEPPASPRKARGAAGEGAANPPSRPPAAPAGGRPPAKDALARAVALLGEVPAVTMDLEAERGGEQRRAKVSARPQGGGAFKVEGRGGAPLDFGSDGTAWWIRWRESGETLRRAPLASSPFDYVALARGEALGLTAEIVPVLEGVADAAASSEDGARTIEFHVAESEGLARIDPASGRLTSFELRAAGTGGALFLSGRYAYPTDAELPAAALATAPSGADAAWRVAEDAASRAVIVKVERDRMGRVEVQGFVEGAPCLLTQGAAIEARGRDEGGVEYRGLEARMHESQTENDLASSPALGHPFRVLLAPEEGRGARALESRVMEIAAGSLVFTRVQLPPPSADALSSSEAADVAPPEARRVPGVVSGTARKAPAKKKPAKAPQQMLMCFPAALVLGQIAGLTAEERAALAAASSEGRLTIEVVASVCGAERAAALRKKNPIIQPGLALCLLEGAPALPYMYLRFPGMERITIRPARIREAFPEVAESKVATLVTEAKKGTLTVGRLCDEVLGGADLPGPEGAVARDVSVAVLEP